MFSSLGLPDFWLVSSLSAWKMIIGRRESSGLCTNFVPFQITAHASHASHASEALASPALTAPFGDEASFTSLKFMFLPSFSLVLCTSVGSWKNGRVIFIFKVVPHALHFVCLGSTADFVRDQGQVFSTSAIRRVFCSALRFESSSSVWTLVFHPNVTYIHPVFIHSFAGACHSTPLNFENAIWTPPQYE